MPGADAWKGCRHRPWMRVTVLADESIASHVLAAAKEAVDAEETR